MAVELRPGRERPGKGFFGKAPAGAKSEATAGWERPIVTALHAAGIALSRANPRQVRDFARGCGQRAKTDAIDTQVLAAFEAANAPAATPAPDAQQAGLSAWVTRREQLQGMLVAERARLIPGLPKAVAADLAASVDGLEKHLAQVVARLAAPLAESAEIGGQGRPALFDQRVGPGTAATLLGHRPELGTLGRGQIAALAGLAPLPTTADHGAGSAHIAGGRVSGRGALLHGRLQRLPLRSGAQSLLPAPAGSGQTLQGRAHRHRQTTALQPTTGNPPHGSMKHAPLASSRFRRSGVISGKYTAASGLWTAKPRRK